MKKLYFNQNIPDYSLQSRIQDICSPQLDGRHLFRFPDNGCITAPSD